MRRKKSKSNSISFSEAVYKATRRIPSGKVATYAWIAKRIKNPRAVRAVGNALNKNPYAPEVPCHRVIRSDGTLGGFAHGTRAKEGMLRKEKVKIVNGKVNRSYILK